MKFRKHSTRNVSGNSFNTTNSKRRRKALDRVAGNAFQPLEALEQRLMLAADIALFGVLASNQVQAVARNDATPTATDGTYFGSVNLYASAASTFRISNTGDATLTLTGSKVTITDYNAADFTLTQVVGTTITAGQSKDFAITFHPKALGERYAVVSVFSSDADESPYQFLIEGTGILQDVAVYGGESKDVAIPRNDATPSMADHTNFGTVLPGAPGVPWVFRIRNAGTDALNLTNVTITGANSADFALTSAFTPATIPAAPGAVDNPSYKDISITFTPSAMGVRTATVNVYTNDPDEPVYSFKIQGTGGVRDLAVFGGDGKDVEIPRNDSTPSLTDGTNFGYAMIGGTATTRTFRIYNMGGDWLNLTGDKIKITSSSGAISTAFTLTALPSNYYTGADNEVTTDDIAFLPIPKYPGLPASTGPTLPANPNYRDITITFAPNVTGVQTATVTLYSDDPDEPVYSFKIQGTSGTADIALFGGPTMTTAIPRNDITPSLTDHTDFGTVDLGGAAGSWTFRITNTGQAALQVGRDLTPNDNSSTKTAVQILDGNGAVSTAFSCSFTATVIPGVPAATGSNPNYRDITIYFDPTALGLHTATVNIYSDDPDEGTYSFAVKGTGVAERLTGATEDTPFLIDYDDLWEATHEGAQPAADLLKSFVISSVKVGALTITHNAVTAPVVAGTTVFAPGDSLTWTPPANANRTIQAFTAAELTDAVAGPAIAVRIEVAPAADNPLGTIANQVVNATKTIDLTKLFRDPDSPGTIVQFVLNQDFADAGTAPDVIYAHLFTSLTPKTVANFLKYVSAKKYDGSWIHRSISDFVIQGGGYRTQDPATAATAASAIAVTTYAPVVNEYNIASLTGTLAMAKLGNDPNSATSQWFFNLADNSQNLDNQNGGFSVFGEVMGDGMSVVNAIGDVTIYNAGGDLSSLPLRNYVTGNVTNGNLIVFTSVSVVTPLTYSIVSNVNHENGAVSSPVVATLVDGKLTLTPVAGRSGYADITVRVTDRAGESTDVTFTAAATAVSVTASDASAGEVAAAAAANGGKFTFTRTGPIGVAQSVQFVVTGTAVKDTDYTITGVNGAAVSFDAGTGRWTVTIPAFSASASVNVNVVQDTEKEGPETVIATIVNGANYVGAGSPATVTIADNDPFYVWVEALDASAAETPAAQAANGGVFRVHRDVAAATPLTVSLTRTGTATSGADFAALPVSVIIPANQDYVEVPLSVINDTASEQPETVVLAAALRAGGGYVLDPDTVNHPSSATVTIADNDTAAKVAASDAAAAEVATATLNGGKFTFTRTRALNGSPLAVEFTLTGLALAKTADDQAVYDYTVSNATYADGKWTVIIAADKTTATVGVTVLNDALPEGVETVVATVLTTAGMDPAAPATINIADDDPFVVSISATDDAAAEVASGDPNTGAFTISRGVAATGPLTVYLNGAATGTGTATSGTDFTALPASVTIPANQASVTLTVDAINDALAEAEETVILGLGTGPGYVLDPVLANRTATVTIADNEPTLTVSALDAAASEAGPDTATFRITRTGSTASSLSFSFSLSGDATRGTDYVTKVNNSTFTTNALSFAAGQDTVDILIYPLTDTLEESTETLVLTLTSSGTYHLPATPSATIELASNQRPALTAVDPLNGAVVNQPFRITYDQLRGAADEFDPEGLPMSFQVIAISSGTLTKNGTAVTPAMLTAGLYLASGEELVWTPPADVTGAQSAFTIKAFDDVMTSTTAVQVTVNLAPG